MICEFCDSEGARTRKIPPFMILLTAPTIDLCADCWQDLQLVITPTRTDE